MVVKEISSRHRLVIIICWFFIFISNDIMLIVMNLSSQRDIHFVNRNYDIGHLLSRWR